MSQRKLVLYIAMSLDGLIAGEDDDITWLSIVEQEGEDYGYYKFIQTVDTVIMGRKTYDKVLSFGIDFPHSDKKCYVLSSSKTGKDENVEYWNTSVQDLIAEIRQNDGLNIYCDGGSGIVFELMKHHLIDEYVISIIPIMLGKGIPLFKPGREKESLKLKKATSFPKGLVQLHYERK